MDARAEQVPRVLWSAARASCPTWCVTGHGVHLGEEDWVHLSEPLSLADGVSAQLCMSIDPLTDTHDGPYVVIGTTEYNLAEAQALGASLMTLATVGADTRSAPAV